MKNLFLLVFLLSLWSCATHQKTQSHATESDLAIKEISQRRNVQNSNQALNPNVAFDFLHSYNEHIQNSVDAYSIIRWAQSTPYATQTFKKELETLVSQALKVDSQLGLGFDPIYDAQDYPSEGLEIHSFNPENGLLILKGIEWEDFRVNMKLLHQNGETLVHGCGVVNMPVHLRSKR